MQTDPHTCLLCSITPAILNQLLHHETVDQNPEPEGPRAWQIHHKYLMSMVRLHSSMPCEDKLLRFLKAALQNSSRQTSSKGSAQSRPLRSSQTFSIPKTQSPHCRYSEHYISLCFTMQNSVKLTLDEFVAFGTIWAASTMLLSNQSWEIMHCMRKLGRGWF